MSNTQLYLAVGLPVLTILIGILIQLVSTFSLRAELSSLRIDLTKRIDGVESRIDTRMDRFENSLNEMRTTFIKDHTERLVRLEERVFHP